VVLSIAPKSVTTPVAMAISEQLGGLPSLTAALVILTGITGAVLAAPLFAFARIRDERARGLALGTAAHGIGTARALQESHTAGAFAGLAMGVNALISAVVLPWLVPLLLR
jgi:putative effector of murein hydrolase